MCRAQQCQTCTLCGARSQLWTAACFTTTPSQVRSARRASPLRPQCMAASFLTRSASVQGVCETLCAVGMSLQSCASRSQLCMLICIKRQCPGLCTRALLVPLPYAAVSCAVPALTLQAKASIIDVQQTLLQRVPTLCMQLQCTAACIRICIVWDWHLTPSDVGLIASWLVLCVITLHGELMAVSSSCRWGWARQWSYWHASWPTPSPPHPSPYPPSPTWAAIRYTSFSSTVTLVLQEAWIQKTLVSCLNCWPILCYY